MRISSRTILACGTAFAGLVLPAIATAQTTTTVASAEPAAAPVTADDANIVVTGSRIRHDGFNSPVPVTVVDAGLIKNLGQTNAARSSA